MCRDTSVAGRAPALARQGGPGRSVERRYGRAKPNEILTDMHTLARALLPISDTKYLV